MVSPVTRSPGTLVCCAVAVVARLTSAVTSNLMVCAGAHSIEL